MPTTSGRKRKTFPELDAAELELLEVKPLTESDHDNSDSDSDAPEAVTLTSGRAVADARDDAVQNHQKRLKDKKKAANKAREAFIQSTKSKSHSIVPTNQKPPTLEDNVSEDESGSGEGGEEVDPALEELEGDPVLLARMQKAMQDAMSEDDEKDGPSDEEIERLQPHPIGSSARLPDSVFAAAAAEQLKPERKRKKTSKAETAQLKRRRVREGPTERIVGGLAIRVTNALNAPPPPSRLSRKVATGVKGGATFRQRWKKRDATQAQIRSRSGPAQSFATSK